MSGNARGKARAALRDAGAPVDVHPQDQFQPDVTLLMFPLDGLNVGKLAVFRLQHGDRWFDDVIANMRMVATVEVDG